MYSTSCSTTPSDNCALPLIKIAKSDTQMVSWATRCGLWPLIHQHLCYFFRGGEKILLIAETFCVVSLQGLCTACTQNDSHKASLIYLYRKYAVVFGQWNSIAQKMRKPVNCFEARRAPKKIVYRKAEKNCWERILMFTAGASQYFSVGISGLREINWWESMRRIREGREKFCWKGFRKVWVRNFQLGFQKRKNCFTKQKIIKFVRFESQI